MKIKFVIFVIFSLFSIQSIGQTIDFEFSEICIGDTTILTSTATSFNDPILFWAWDFTDNGQFNDATGEQIKFKFPQAKTYRIGLRIITQSGFSEAFYQDVQVGSFPIANFISENSCANEFTNFINLSTIENEDLEDFLWDFGDGGTNNYQTNPNHWYQSSGSYSVRLIAQSNLGCNDTIIKQVNIQSVPEFSFEFSGETTFNEGESIIVTAIGDFDDILWNNGLTTPSITITTGGYYAAEVKKGGCPNLKSFTIVVVDKVGITNLITPNGDGFNDYWEIFHIENHSPCQVSLYSRDGMLVYSSTNYNNRWNGTYNGNPLPEGTYYYIVNCDKGLSQKGALSIIR